MRNIALTIIALILFSGCGAETPTPSSRLVQPAGDFSLVTPDGWYRTNLAGIDYVIVSGEPDFGAKPNLFVDFVEIALVSNMLQEVFKAYQSESSYEVVQQTNFVTESGLSGLKITASRENNDSLPLATFHYLLQDKDRTIAITASCAEPVKKKNELIFDAAIQSLRSEHTSQHN